MSDNHIRLAVVGNVDAGKSTLIGTLISSKLDDGRGSGRSHITKHKHELETGRTSTIGVHLLGFDVSGNVVSGCDRRESDLVQKSHNLVSLMDMAGHEKYLKTTIAGVSRGMVDYALILVNSMQPPTHMTVHHLNLCVSYEIPVIVVMTKSDRCPLHVFDDTRNVINRILKSSEIGLTPYNIRKKADIETVKDKVSAPLSTVTPVLTVSSVTGEGLELLKMMLSSLPKRRRHETKRGKPFEFLVEEVLTVSGVGTVVSGFVNRGEWRVGESIYIGPLMTGECIKVNPKSCHVAQTDVCHVWAGHWACFAISISKQHRKLLRRGMVALKEPITLCRSFTAVIKLLKGNTVTITKDIYQSTVHILHMRQTARVVGIHVSDDFASSQVTIRQGGHAFMSFELARAGYVRKGMKIVLRDGHVRGIGKVTTTEHAHMVNSKG